MHTKSRAIVLHRFSYSDSSWIIKALTEESGVISFIVKGAKKSDSRFKAELDPLTLSEFVFKRSSNSELQFINEATLINWYPNLRKNLLHFSQALVISEIILKYAPQGIPLHDEFNLLIKTLEEYELANNPLTIKEEKKSLANNPFDINYPKSNIFSKWILNICNLWGYNLELSTCSRCGTLLNEAPLDFYPESGSIICKSCLNSQIPRVKKETTLGIWSLYTNKKIINPEYLENALITYLLHQIGFIKKINSLKFLNETRKLTNNNYCTEKI